MAGVTDKLIELAELAKKQDASYKVKLEELKTKHFDTLRELGLTEVGSQIEGDFSNLQDVLRAIWIGRDYSEATLELIAGHGEVWSAQILQAHLAALNVASGAPLGAPPRSRWLDARQVLVVRPGETGPAVDWEVSEARFLNWLQQDPTSWVVVTGYVASTPEGVATTLKRNGSDFSASIFGRLADASAIIIWTDVDGVLSADPRPVRSIQFVLPFQRRRVTWLAARLRRLFFQKFIMDKSNKFSVCKGALFWQRSGMIWFICPECPPSFLAHLERPESIFAP